MNWHGRGVEPYLFRLERWLNRTIPEPLHGWTLPLWFVPFVIALVFDLIFIPNTEPRMKLEKLIWDAVEKRFKEIHPNHVPRGPRQRPSALGWRFVQNLEISKRSKELGENIIEKIEKGEYDKDIKSTLEDAIQADRYYTEEKDWGHDLD